MTKRPLTHMAAAALILAGSSLYPFKANAASLTYNAATNAGWFAPDAWNGPATWQSGDSATIDAGATINFDSDTAISGMTVGGSSSVVLTSTAAHALTFSGGHLHITNPLGLQTGGGVSLQGNFELTGPSTGFLRLSGSAAAAAYSGTATITVARFEWSSEGNVGLNSNFVINGGLLQNRNNGSSSLGSVTLNSGTFELGRNNSNTNNSTTTISSLSGTGGSIVSPIRSGSASLTLLRTLNVNQTADTTFQGAINGVNDGARIALNKQNAGDLTLSGTVTLARQTEVTGGSLYINGADAYFSNEVEDNETAIHVNGGTLGGTGTLTISGGDKVVLSAIGSLAAGVEGAVGRTTYDFTEGGGLDLSAATAGTAENWLKFELGAYTAPGVTYDQISLTAGTLVLGTGLNFSDFDFDVRSGFAPGLYTLFSTSEEIDGSLGMAEGILGGFNATLGISGNNLVLTVVPEPAAISLLFGSGVLIYAARRRMGKVRS